jgi:hypothetical protein
MTTSGLDFVTSNLFGGFQGASLMLVFQISRPCSSNFGTFFKIMHSQAQCKNWV